MSKIIRRLFRSIEQKSKLDLITELLVIENSTTESIILFEKVKANFVLEMKKREREKKYECRLIRELVEKEKDPNFDKPINEISVTL